MTEIELEEEFTRLAEDWYNRTGWSSRILVEDEAYQAIIQLGYPVVPIILNSMKTKRNWWFHALIMITGENASDKSHAGNLRKMTEDWLRWGEEKGLI